MEAEKQLGYSLFVCTLFLLFADLADLADLAQMGVQMGVQRLLIFDYLLLVMASTDRLHYQVTALLLLMIHDKGEKQD